MTAEDNLYSAETSSIQYIAVVGVEKAGVMGEGILYLICGVLLAILLAGAVVLIWKKKGRKE